MDVIRLDGSLTAGCYLVRGRSGTVWVLDWRPPLPAYVVRLRGDGSPSDSIDGRWVPLVEVASIDPETGAGEPGVIRVGRRHRWTTNAGARTHWPESWVVQSRCTDIGSVSGAAQRSCSPRSSSAGPPMIDADRVALHGVLSPRGVSPMPARPGWGVRP